MCDDSILMTEAVFVYTQALELLQCLLVQGSARVLGQLLTWLPLLRFLVHPSPEFVQSAGSAASFAAGTYGLLGLRFHDSSFSNTLNLIPDVDVCVRAYVRAYGFSFLFFCFLLFVCCVVVCAWCGVQRGGAHTKQLRP